MVFLSQIQSHENNVVRYEEKTHKFIYNSLKVVILLIFLQQIHSNSHILNAEDDIIN